VRSTTARQKPASPAKTDGIHYTPPELATFLAEATWKAVPKGHAPLRVLDPACGTGELLQAIVTTSPAHKRRELLLTGYETDTAALERAQSVLASVGAPKYALRHQDFLSANTSTSSRIHETDCQTYDVVIANPPYVRTQVLGAKKSHNLAKRFGLSGRVDLYQGFAMAMARVLTPGGVLGLLISNRFLSIKAGRTLRQFLASHFELHAIYDLGDTRLFSAAVLPVVVIARKGKIKGGRDCLFDRVYRNRSTEIEPQSANQHHSLLAALRDRDVHGVVRTPHDSFCIERGRLVVEDDAWSLMTPQREDWLRTVRQHQFSRFGQMGKARVGIKTTADEVFIRGDWDTLPPSLRPEDHLLRPLLTHHNAGRWIPHNNGRLRRVLYPHTMLNGRRAVIDLAGHPAAAAYLQTYRERLTRRRYVLNAGRKWYEIWVPHNPDGWAKPRIVFPDIAEHPRFCFDRSGAIVNGDCYWITLHAGIEDRWLLLMLAVANSTFITHYYDAIYHNKLYAGRRRFMTQYVAQFPLPNLDSSIGRQIVHLVSRLLSHSTTNGESEREIDDLVWKAFHVRSSNP
jgi:tRNA1(Val) A37 N6-methylase TrmN6